MNDAVLVRLAERLGDVRGNLDGLIDRQLVLAIEPLPKRLAIHMDIT